jgi:putative RecB family exonuclease
LPRWIRHKPESNPEALVFGSTIHACLAEYYACAGQGFIMPVDALMAAFEQRWQSVAQKPGQVSFKEGNSPEAMLAQGKALLAIFHQEVPKENCRVLGIEQPFAFGLDGLPIPIIGVFDLVIEDEAGVVTIVDHKTCAKAYSDREIDDSFQLTVYHMAAKADGHADGDVLLRFDCLVKTKVPKFIQYYTTRAEADFMAARRKILAVWDGIQKGVFIPNDASWRYKGCGFASRCKDWFAGMVE